MLDGYHAHVDPASVGLEFDVIAFATLARPDATAEFDAALAAVPEVIQADRLFGEPDYMVRIVAADRDAYQRLYETTLCTLPGLRSLNSTFVMKHVIAERPLPLRHG